MLVSLLIVLLAIILYMNGRYAWWLPAVDYKHPRILMYHMIAVAEKKHRFKGLRVSPGMFERQLRWLCDNGWHFVTMEELYRLKDRLPERTVAVTFDDGFADNCTEALPLLKKYQAKATLYLYVDRHDNNLAPQPKVQHAGREMDGETKLTDQQVQELVDSGIFEIGSHSLTHPNLLNAGSETKLNEIEHSKQLIERQFNTTVHSFAYPFGLYDEEDVSFVRKAGYATAVTTIEGIDDLAVEDPLQLRRVKISGKDNFFAFKLRMRRGVRGIW